MALLTCLSSPLACRDSFSRLFPNNVASLSPACIADSPRRPERIKIVKSSEIFSSDDPNRRRRSLGRSIEGDRLTVGVKTRWSIHLPALNSSLFSDQEYWGFVFDPDLFKYPSFINSAITRPIKTGFSFLK